MYALETLFSQSRLPASFTDCIEVSVCDEIREDIQRNQLKTTNSVPTRIWDILNTNLAKLSGICTITVVRRGPWQMLVIYDRETECVFTFMREARYLELKKGLSKRKNMHYLDVLTRAFNSYLPANDEQLSWFAQEAHEFADQDRMKEKLNEILMDLKDEADVIRHHVLVLFEASNFHLRSVRAAIVTPSLEIAQEVDWTGYITHHESSVVEQVETRNSPKNVPTLGLNLKQKAIKRQQKNPLKKRTEEESVKNAD